ncbi:MAG: TraB/GumN family protein [Rhabdochlamydiaceae bacterium]|nr:TraB/GumN family protein [Candidatus Amphrikana amoebophyrae]
MTRFQCSTLPKYIADLHVRLAEEDRLEQFYLAGTNLLKFLKKSGCNFIPFDTIVKEKAVYQVLYLVHAYMIFSIKSSNLKPFSLYPLFALLGGSCQLDTLSKKEKLTNNSELDLIFMNFLAQFRDSNELIDHLTMMAQESYLEDQIDGFKELSSGFLLGEMSEKSRRILYSTSQLLHSEEELSNLSSHIIKQMEVAKGALYVLPYTAFESRPEIKSDLKAAGITIERKHIPYQGLLYKIISETGKVVGYLYGTFHGINEYELLHPTMLTSFDQCNQVYFELDLSNKKADAANIRQEAQDQSKGQNDAFEHLVSLPEDEFSELVKFNISEIKDNLTPIEKEAFFTLLKKIGSRVQALNFLFEVKQAIIQKKMMLSKTPPKTLLFENILIQRAQHLGSTIGGLEPFLSRGERAPYLFFKKFAFDTIDEQLKEAVGLNVDCPLAEANMSEYLDRMDPELYHILQGSRNPKIVQKIVQYIKANPLGRCFFSVGILHTRDIVFGLRHLGFKVTLMRPNSQLTSLPLLRSKL